MTRVETIERIKREIADAEAILEEMESRDEDYGDQGGSSNTAEYWEGVVTTWESALRLLGEMD